MKIKRILTYLLTMALVMSILPADMAKAGSAGYNASAALQYAASHWNDGQGLCAEFVSKCVQAGGLPIKTELITTNCYNAVSNYTGVQGQDLKLDANGYATKSLDGNILSAGDVVIQWCYTHTYRPHILICGGYDSSGYATFYAHNSAKNNERYRFNVTYSSQAPCTRSCNIGAKVLHISDGDTVVSDTSNPGSPYPIPTGILRSGSRGDSVKWVQKFANDVMGAGISVDGIYGNQTINAVRNFQQQNGLSVDGIVGTQTTAKMLAVWRDKVTPKPLDLGNEFTGLILRKDIWKTIKNTGDNVVLWDEKPTADYYWLFKKQSDGTYIIQSLYDGTVLDVYGAYTASGTNVFTCDANGGDNQKWYIYASGNAYRFVPKHAQGLSLDVYNADTGNGTNIHAYTSNDTVAQRFDIYKVTYNKLTGISINSNYQKEMYVGSKQTLKYNLLPSNAISNMVTWSSSNSTVASVDQSGVVTAKKAGTVTIQCTSTFDKSISGSVKLVVESIPTTEPTTQEPTTTESKVETTTEVTTEVVTEEPREEETTEVATEEVTEEPKEEETTEVVTEEPKEEETTEVTTEVVTEEPKTEVTTEVVTEEPKTEVTTEVVTEEPKTEVTTEVVTEEPKTEMTTEVVTEEPKTEVTTGVVTEEPKEEERTEVTTESKVDAAEVEQEDTDEWVYLDDELLPEDVGTVLYDYKNHCKVRVTNDNRNYPEVEYIKSTRKNAKNVTIPEKVIINGITYVVTGISNNAFRGNKKLKSVTISKNIKKIGKNAFRNCKKLKKITIKTSKLTKIESNAFKNISKKVKIIVPKTKKSAYKYMIKKAGFGK